MLVDIPWSPALSVALAFASWHAVEHPSLRLKDAITARVAARRGTSARPTREAARPRRRRHVSLPRSRRRAARTSGRATPLPGSAAAAGDGVLRARPCWLRGRDWPAELTLPGGRNLLLRRRSRRSWPRSLGLPLPVGSSLCLPVGRSSGPASECPLLLGGLGLEGPRRSKSRRSLRVSPAGSRKGGVDASLDLAAGSARHSSCGCSVREDSRVFHHAVDRDAPAAMSVDAGDLGRPQQELPVLGGGHRLVEAEPEVEVAASAGRPSRSAATGSRPGAR